jgi:hypothetical protein
MKMTKESTLVSLIVLLFLKYAYSIPAKDNIEIVKISDERNVFTPLQPIISSFDCRRMYIQMQESTIIENYQVRLNNTTFITSSPVFQYTCPSNSTTIEFSYSFSTSDEKISTYSMPVRLECGSRLLSECNSSYNMKRNLVPIATAQNSLVTGSGLGPSVVAMNTYTVNVQARDSTNTPLTSGGAIFKI